MESTTSAVGQVVDNKRIVDLPLNQRNAYALMFLVPGVTGSTSFNASGGTNFSINGGRFGSNEIVLDGVPSTPPIDNRNWLSIYPSVDAVQEFRVQTSNYSAEFGRSGGGVINLIYKSGTYELRGSLFEFHRNSVFDANNFFANRNAIPLDSFKRNQFGGSIGGPIVRDKTFFFFDYEGLRERRAANLLTTVPTEAMRRGDFSGLRNAAGQPIVIYDPTTTASVEGGFVRQPFEGNIIPQERMDPVAARTTRIGTILRRASVLPTRSATKR